MEVIIPKEKNYCCNNCDYYLTAKDFDEGKGRIMFCEGKNINEGEYKCGVCDPRCSDEEGKDYIYAINYK